MNIRRAVKDDIPTILSIYNEGIIDRIATLEADPKDEAYMGNWFKEHQERFAVLVAEIDGKVIGWASLNPYSHRCAYAGVADVSIYIRRINRGQGIGKNLLKALEKEAKEQKFHKLVLFTFPFNDAGLQLYRGLGFREVGIFVEQGQLDGKFIDVMAMEKILTSTSA